MKELRRKIENDPYLKFLGIKLKELNDGFALCTLTLTPDMINFMGVPHGGLIFSLADAALSAASNSEHYPSYAINISGSFLARVKIGDELVSTSKRIYQTRKTALYEMNVFHGENLIATFNGTVYRSHS